MIVLHTAIPTISDRIAFLIKIVIMTILSCDVHSVGRIWHDRDYHNTCEAGSNIVMNLSVV